jgi:putative addiction module antidote
LRSPVSAWVFEGCEIEGSDLKPIRLLSDNKKWLLGTSANRFGQPVEAESVSGPHPRPIHVKGCGTLEDLFGQPVNVESVSGPHPWHRCRKAPALLLQCYHIRYNINPREDIMPKVTTIRAIGNSAGATIPKAMLDRYRMTEGDQVHLIETEQGILISPYDPDFAEGMEVYEEGAKRFRNAMRELAK